MIEFLFGVLVGSWLTHWINYKKEPEYSYSPSPSPPISDPDGLYSPSPSEPITYKLTKKNGKRTKPQPSSKRGNKSRS